jgi:microcystin degradation protein MlrC
VKSSHRFHAKLALTADRIISVATLGGIRMNFAEIDYRKRRDLNFFLRVGDPLA